MSYLDNKSGIYKITNLVTGTIYIGSATNLSSRKSGHFGKGQHNRYLRRAIEKYSIKNFSFEIIEYCEPKDCIKREQYYLDTLLFAQEYIKSNHKDRRFRELSYNINPTAKSSFGKEVSNETREKLRIINLGKKRNLTVEQLKRMTATHKGKRYGEETLKKMSSWQIEVPKKQEHKESISNTLVNKLYRVPKLNPVQISIIRKSCTDISQNELAKIFRVSGSLVNGIVNNQFYKSERVLK